MPPIEADTHPRPANRHWLEGLAALLALFAALFIANQFDSFFSQTRLQSRQTFNVIPILWGPPIANLVLGFVLLLLARWVAASMVRRLWLGLAYLVAGIAAVFYMPLLFTFNLGRIGAPMLVGFSLTGILSYWTVTGTVLAIVGGLHLWPRR